MKASEMFALTQLSQKLLEERALKVFDPMLWIDAFDACSSPLEWKEFLENHEGDPRVKHLADTFQEIHSGYQVPIRRTRSPLVGLDDGLGTLLSAWIGKTSR